MVAINFPLQTALLLPPRKRKPIKSAFLNVPSAYLTLLQNTCVFDYMVGFQGSAWDGVNTYNLYDRVKYIDHAVYEALQAVPINTPPGTLDPNGNPYWLKVLNIWIGATERYSYNSGKLCLEFALNRWFETNFVQPTSFVAAPVYYLPKSDIYIDGLATNVGLFSTGINEVYSDSTAINDNFTTASTPITETAPSSIAFNINVPLAVYDALIPSQPSGTTPDKDNVIRAIADKYVCTGLQYTITPY